MATLIGCWALGTGQLAEARVVAFCLWLDEIKSTEGQMDTGEESYRVYQFFPVFDGVGTGEAGDPNTIVAVENANFELVSGTFFQTEGIPPTVPNRDVTGYDPSLYPVSDVEHDTYVSIGLRDNPTDIDQTLGTVNVTSTTFSGDWLLAEALPQGASTDVGVGGNAGLPDVFLGQFGVLNSESTTPALNTGRLALEVDGVTELRNDAFLGEFTIVTADGQRHLVRFIPVPEPNTALLVSVFGISIGLCRRKFGRG